MNKVFFTADTHFSSDRTLELSKRPFIDNEDMDDFIIDQWNTRVSDDDTIIHLGDFGAYRILDKLNGNKILIEGNYEYKDFQRMDSDSTKRFFYEEHGIEFYPIYHDAGENMSLIFDIENHDLLYIDGGSVTKYNNVLYLTHEPDNRFYDENNKLNIMNLFGHIHKLCMVKRFGLNVGTDCHSFAPITLDDVLFYKNAILNFYDEKVFMR